MQAIPPIGEFFLSLKKEQPQEENAGILRGREISNDTGEEEKNRQISEYEEKILEIEKKFNAGKDESGRAINDEEMAKLYEQKMSLDKKKIVLEDKLELIQKLERQSKKSKIEIQKIEKKISDMGALEQDIEELVNKKKMLEEEIVNLDRKRERMANGAKTVWFTKVNDNHLIIDEELIEYEEKENCQQEIVCLNHFYKFLKSKMYTLPDENFGLLKGRINREELRKNIQLKEAEFRSSLENSDLTDETEEVFYWLNQLPLEIPKNYVDEEDCSEDDDYSLDGEEEDCSLDFRLMDDFLNKMIENIRNTIKPEGTCRIILEMIEENKDKKFSEQIRTFILDAFSQIPKQERAKMLEGNVHGIPYELLESDYQ